MYPRRRISLMPIIVFAALGLLAWVPLYSSMHVEAATAQRIALITVAPGDTVWSIASHYAHPNEDVSSVVDQIVDDNHLVNAELVPGRQIRVPE